MCKRNLKKGVRVFLNTPYVENGVAYNKGVIRNSLDGEYWYIRVQTMPDESIIVERYFTDLRTE